MAYRKQCVFWCMLLAVVDGLEENVASRGTASQSSTYLSYGAGRAVDGITGHHLDSSTCTHTDNPNAYWQVTFNKIYNIRNFRIYNRGVSDCTPGPCGARLNGFTVHVGNSSANSQLCYQDTTASNTGPGNIIDGACTNGPIAGNTFRISISSQYLTLCEVFIYACSAGWYGDTCQRRCVTTTGCSACDPNGIWCQACVSRRWGEHCLANCGHCRANNCVKQDGECRVVGTNPRCTAGFEGTRCITPCTGTKWGPDCRNDCGQCNNGAMCDKTSGECPPSSPRCSPGYMGTRCDTACSGKWGPDCQHDCGQCNNGAVCDKTSGVCPPSTPHCSPGYMGTRCDTACSGKWGADCPNDCGQCNNGAVCDKTSGVCPPSTPHCSPGYMGTHCDTACSGKWGADCPNNCGQCNNGAVCDKTSGVCPPSTPRCSPGYMETLCNTSCPFGKWGADCPNDCGQCNNESVCDKASGECPPSTPRCSPGYMGALCNTTCPSGKWGADCPDDCGQCNNGAVCNKTSGECPPSTPRCSPGYFGTRCDTACTLGKWGADCQNNCSHCNNVTACDRTSGECPPSTHRCSPGYMGTSCDTLCTDGTWGQDCNEACSKNCLQGDQPCAPQNGTCLSGCAATFGGDRCTEKLTSSADPTQSAVIGGVVGAVVLVAVVIAVVIILRKRRQGASKTEERELAANGLRPVDRQQGQNADVGPDDAGVVVNEQRSEVVSPAPVPVDQLQEHVDRQKAADSFKTEFESFPVGLHAKHTAADQPENKARSRYKNLVAYDHSRVVLQPDKDLGRSDYINACHINGYRAPKKFIASQGPNKVILNDFVRMIWEHNCGKVVMVTNLVEGIKSKCDQYWPNEGSKQFGVIGVTFLDEDIYANYIIRTLQLSHAMVPNKTKTVRHFHFTTWPDHGVPSDATGLLDLRDKVNGYKTDLSGPIVVHCSAGIGRTGTYIALDYLIEQAEEERVVDVPACVRLLREQRVNMVQTQEQYEFIYEALIEALLLNHSSLASVEFSGVYADLCTINPETGRSKMMEQFKNLDKLTAPLEESTLKSARHPDNINKNRSSQILAADSCRPFLSTPVAGYNDYINAVYLPSYKLRKSFLLTQTPLPNTVVDLWRLVYDHSISTIVMLDRIEKGAEGVRVYWPVEQGEYGPFEVGLTECSDKQHVSVRTYQLVYKEQKVVHPIKQFRCKFWKGDPSPESIPSLLGVLEEAEAWRKKTGNNPIVVHCRDGVTKSGLYCAASSVIERLKVDQEVNILQTVKQMRANRPQIITDLKQYHFLHQVVMGHLENFQTYANFP